MKKKLITALLLTMIVGVVGCGKAEETIEPTVETVAETTVEETVVETVVEETTVEEEESIVEETTEEVAEDPTSEANSTAQIIKLLEAYNSILSTDDFLIQMAQDNCETTSGKFDTEEGKFADGTSCTRMYTVISIAIEYYENYLTKTELFNTREWMSQQASEEDVLLMNFEAGEDDAIFSTIRLWDAIYACPYLMKQSKIELVNRVETDEYKYISGEVSSYTYDLVFNGMEDTGFKAIFDSNGILLNLGIPSDFELEYYSFDNSIWEVR